MFGLVWFCSKNQTQNLLLVVFEVYNIVLLTAGAMLYRSRQLILLAKLKIYTHWNNNSSLSLPLATGNHHSTLCLCEFDYFVCDDMVNLQDVISEI